MSNQIPRIDYNLLCNNIQDDNYKELKKLRVAVNEYGFFIMKNYPININKIANVFSLYKTFFKQSFNEKNKVNMSKTASNRGWGGIKAEQVNSDFNPDNLSLIHI